MSSTTEKYYLELSSNPIRFQSVSTVTNVFFDDSNRQVFAVRSGGATGVVVKGPTEESSTSFVMEPKGPVISIKFSPNQKVLAIQRSKTSVEFVNFPNERDSVEYTQSCKGKSTIILGFVWTGVNEIAFITDHGIELFQVVPERRLLKSLRNQSATANWFVHCPRSGMVLLSSGNLGHTLQPFLFKPGNIVRLPKFEVEPPTGAPSSGAGNAGSGVGGGPRAGGMLPERDVTLGVLYGNPSVLVLRHHRPRPTSQHAPNATSLASPATAPPRSLHFSRPPPVPHQPAGNPPLGAEIVIYTLQGTSNPKKTHILELNMSGRFAVNIVDNLVIVHHEASKTSVLFDVALPGETDCGVTRHKPVAPPRPIRPFSLRLPQPLPHAPTEPTEIPCDLYSPNWVVFQPDVIIDAKLGCLWCVGIQLEPLAHLLLPSQAPRLAHFLTLRSALGGEARRVLLSIIEELVLMPSGSEKTETSSYVDPNPGSRLASLAAIFDRLNVVCHEYLRSRAVGQMALSASGSSHLSSNSQGSNSATSQQGNLPNQQHVVLDQSDMYINIFCRMGVNRETGDVNSKIVQPLRPPTEMSEEAWWAGPCGRFASAVLVEYIRSLSEHSIPIQHYLHEMLINALVHRGAFFQLHQFLQYHVIGDSKPLACLLLSLENVYPAAHTLALDMLRRLSVAQEEIVEVLLSRQQILPALRFVCSHGSMDQASARKYLEAARATGDPVLFASVYKFFEGRNLRLRDNPAFTKGEHCDVYVKHYQKLFGTPGAVRAAEST